ncbi:MAG: polyvinylalcohol dehydrogenase, partial [Opitutae bacterium]|nr:polyvinylalcohol dehydrogenase [Opitutae bacterium]
MKFFILTTSFILSSYFSLLASNWPSWRGELRDGVTKETGLLQEWPSNGPYKLWVSDQAGLGYSGFTIQDG